MASDTFVREKVKFVVADSGAFIKNAPIKDIGENIYTIKEVVSEVLDKETRNRLQVLPYEILFREPSTEAIHAVTEFSKKTGDYRSLSAVDLRVIALVYQLEKENVGVAHIKTQPSKKEDWVSSRHGLGKVTDIAGFYLHSKKEHQPQSGVKDVCEVNSPSEPTNEATDECEVNSPSEPTNEATDVCEVNSLSEPTNGATDVCEVNSPSEPTNGATDVCEVNSPSEATNGATDVAEVNSPSEPTNEATDECEVNSPSEPTNEVIDNRRMSQKRLVQGDILSEELVDSASDEEEEEEEGEEDSDSDDGWITPDNIGLIKQKMEPEKTQLASVTVGCLTTDFAMQNVLIQMGLNVISVDGMLIKQARSYVLWCMACRKICTVLTKLFCPSCGNKTLNKISMSVKEDGSIRYNFSSRRLLNHRGLKYSLPPPQGGKHSNNPILVEDQKVPQQRPTKKSLHRMNVFDDNYIVGQSPFKIHDLNSRAAKLGIMERGNNPWNKRNPNEVGRKFSKKRK